MSRMTSLLFALAGGAAIAVQARITGSLKVELQESVLSAAVVFFWPSAHGSGESNHEAWTLLREQDAQGSSH